jgi:hypothetical protein
MRITAMEAARRALKFHIQPTIPFGGQRDANDIARVGNGKTRRSGSAKTGRLLVG